MSPSLLHIAPPPSAEAKTQKFSCTGSIDVSAIPVLEALYVLPPGAEVELDFAAVQRVNSMGLAQLLKLFEHWQEKGIRIHVGNANRMVNMLFKMTGLNRFLDGSAAPAAKASSGLEALDGEDGVAQAGGEGKLRFLVNLQSSQYLNGWFFLNTYLQRQLGRDISLEPVHGALGRQDVDITAMEMVFAKPFEAARLLLECRFRPLLRPAGQADEVAVLARADDARARLGDFAGARAVTASADSFVYLLGRFLLDEGGVPSSGLEYDFAGNETKAMQRLFHGEADLLFMLAENFNGLSSHTTRRLKVLDQSDTGFAFHLLCLAPSHAALAKPMTDCLQEMRGSSQGRQVLEDIGVESWAPPAREEVEMLAMLYRRYVGADGVTLAA